MAFAATIAGIAGIAQQVSSLFGGGKMNASQLQDCVGAVGLYGVPATLSKYPQCVPYAAQLGQGGATAQPGYGLPVPYQNQNAFTPPAQQAAHPISFTPAMTMLPKLPQLMAPMSGWTTGGMIGAIGKNALPVLNNAIALASGYQLIKGIWYAPGGQAVGRSRRRRRINPLNYRAALRAARRLDKVQDITRKIEKALPKARRRK